MSLKSVRYLLPIGAIAALGTVVACSGSNDDKLTVSDSNNPANVVVTTYAGENGAVHATCAGTLIAPTRVLTAGHCISGASSARVESSFAKNAKTAAGIRMYTYDWYNYRSDKSHPRNSDFGIIELDRGLEVDEYPTIAEEPLRDGEVVARVRRGAESGTLSKASIQEVESAAYHGESVGFGRNYIMKMEASEVTDTGGALIKNGVIYGVVSGRGTTSNALYVARVDAEIGAGWTEQHVMCAGGGKAGGAKGNGGAGGNVPMPPSNCWGNCGGAGGKGGKGGSTGGGSTTGGGSVGDAGTTGTGGADGGVDVGGGKGGGGKGGKGGKGGSCSGGGKGGKGGKGTQCGGDGGTTGSPGSAGTAGTPGTGSPGSAGTAGTPGTGSPGSAGTAGTPGTGSPGSAGTAGTPGTGSPGSAGTPGTGSPGSAGTPGTGNPGSAGTPGTGNPGSGNPGSGNPGSGNPGSAGTPGTGNPGSAGTPGTGNPGSAGNPGTGNPGSAGNPGDGNPGGGGPGDSDDCDGPECGGCDEQSPNCVDEAIDYGDCNCTGQGTGGPLY